MDESTNVQVSATLNDSLKADAECVKASCQVKPVRNLVLVRSCKDRAGKRIPHGGGGSYSRKTRAKTEDAQPSEIEH